MEFHFLVRSLNHLLTHHSALRRFIIDLSFIHSISLVFSPSTDGVVQAIAGNLDSWGGVTVTVHLRTTLLFKEHFPYPLNNKLKAIEALNPVKMGLDRSLKREKENKTLN